MANLARAEDGFPSVNGSGDRDSRFPSPPAGFKVYDTSTGAQQRYNGTAWVVDSAVGNSARGVYYPDAYGTVDLTGTTDSRAALQAALTAAASVKGIVQLSAGTYGVSGSALSIPPGVWLRGAGITATTVKRLGTATHNVVQNLNFTGSQDADVWVSDLTIDGNKSSGSGLHGLRFTNVLRPRVSRVRVTNCEWACIALFGNGTSPGVNQDLRFDDVTVDSSDDSGIDVSDVLGGEFVLTCRDNAQTDFNIEPDEATESVRGLRGVVQCYGSESNTPASGADIGCHVQGYSQGTYEGVIEDVALTVIARYKDVGVRFDGSKLKNVDLTVTVSNCREQGVLGKTGASLTTGVTVRGRVENCGTSGAGGTYYAGVKLEACTRVDVSGLAIIDARATKLHNYGIEETAASADNCLDATISGWRQTAILSLGSALAKQQHGTLQQFGYLRLQPPATSDQAYRADLQRTTSALNISAVNDNDGSAHPVTVTNLTYTSLALGTTATPSVDGCNLATVAASATAVTDLAGDNGQVVTLVFSGNRTITHGATIKLAGAANFSGTADDTLTLVRVSGVWYEIGRAVI